MEFIEIFTKYWDMAIIGFIAGLAIYLMMKWEKLIKNKFILAGTVYLILILLVFIYSLCVWLFKG